MASPPASSPGCAIVAWLPRLPVAGLTPGSHGLVVPLTSLSCAWLPVVVSWPHHRVCPAGALAGLAWAPVIGGENAKLPPHSSIRRGVLKHLDQIKLQNLVAKQSVVARSLRLCWSQAFQPLPLGDC